MDRVPPLFGETQPFLETHVLPAEVLALKISSAFSLVTKYYRTRHISNFCDEELNNRQQVMEGLETAFSSESPISD